MLTVRDVMRSDVVTATPDESALEAVRRLHEEGIGSVVVVEDSDVVGIFTESDVVTMLVEERDPAEAPLSAVMSTPVRTIDVAAGIDEAARRMREHRVEKLPVLDGGALVGILTTTTLSDYIPHVAHWPASQPAEGERITQRTRPDTAYESPDWEFEYVGHEEQIDVGDVVRFSKPLDEDEVEGFADASGDTNRLHLDESYAEGTRFGRRIVHGTLVSGTISAALARLPGLIIYLSQELSYHGPVDIGERVTAECEVIEDIGDDRYRLATRVLDSDDDAVIDGEAVVLADPIPDT
ncbi:MAG: CBS domain-containing protein, partial [Haloarculaceae archaeon]